MNGGIDHVLSPQRGSEPACARDSALRSGEEPPLASHLVTARALYSHHGIYAGSGRVIHYAGLARGLWRGPVEDVSLEHFAHGRGIRVRHDLPRFDRREVVERARSRLGERSYRILTNNCEHFCAWALRGESRSTQVERLRGAPRTLWRAICTALLAPWRLTNTIVQWRELLSSAHVGMRATPTFFVNGHIQDVSFGLHALVDAVEAVLKK
jgi:hypothetical protein